MKRNVLALDFGASSGRAVLVSYNEETISLQEVHRFENVPLERDGKIYWDLPRLMQNLEIGMQKAYAIAPYDSIGIDTWGVDYGMLDASGNLIENPRHYRDERSVGYSKQIVDVISSESLYARTGTQIMDINTLFQLMSQRDHEGFDGCETLLLMPDLMAYLLTGTISAERSIASTTQMLSVETGDWDRELLEMLQIPTRIFPPIVESGSKKGVLSATLQEKLGLPAIPVTAVCGHDTQCASFAAPAKRENHIFLSCGTWSLFGTVCDTPVVTKRAMQSELSNEIGYGGNVTFLKNIVGLWLIQESRRAYAKQGKCYSFSEIESMARDAKNDSYINPDDPRFTPPGDIPARIQAYCRETNQPVPETDDAIFRCIYESLAMRYCKTLSEIELCTGKHYPVIHMIGGGTKDAFLCQLTADACGCPVTAGPVEATVFGNAAIQLLAIGAIRTLEEAHDKIAASEKIQTYTPYDFSAEKYKKFCEIIEMK